ncbi:MAG: hypothetical protein ACPGH0_01480 [Opitutales bacterium]
MKKEVRKKAVRKASTRTRAPKASTIRLKPELQTALDRISNHLDRPKNKIVNQAVAEFLEKTSYQLRDDIESTLENLRTYRQNDPNFEADIERFADSEAMHAAEDAHEGKSRSTSSQSLTHEIHELMDA